MENKGSESDRRRAPRRVAAGIRVVASRPRVLGVFRSGSDLAGELLDYSLVGCRFSTSAPLASNMRVHLEFIGRHGSHFSCKATVRWCHGGSVQRQFVIGVELDSLSPDQFQVLAELVGSM
jgi:hypothetical protein